MPQFYCNVGHAITYDITKPATCPTCGVSLAPKAVARQEPPAPSAGTARTLSQPKYSWETDSKGLEETDPDNFDILPGRANAADMGISVLDENGAPVSINPKRVRPRNMTLGELRESGEAVGRTERSAPPGNNHALTAADLIRQAQQGGSKQSGA